MDVRLAPLAGVSDWPFRKLCFDQQCDGAYTEMVSAQGYVYAGKQQAVRNLLIRDKHEKKLIVQIFGKEPGIMGEAAKRLCETMLFDGIDINMGCPVHKVVSNGEGCGLMKTPLLAGKIMSEVVKQSSLPVSVKMRLGWDADHINCVEIARIAEDSGIREITVHGRTRTQMYSGHADWTEIARVRQSVSIGVIANGDIIDADTACECMRITGADGVMIGRGAMGNPWIFRQIKDQLGGQAAYVPSAEEKYAAVMEHYRLMMEWKGERIAVTEMRKHLSWYIHGMRNSARMRQMINNMNDMQELLEALSRFFRMQDGDEF